MFKVFKEICESAVDKNNAIWLLLKLNYSLILVNKIIELSNNPKSNNLKNDMSHQAIAYDH